jgi:hypothetical protein
MCRGDDLWGMPHAKLSAGWYPRSLHGSTCTRTRHRVPLMSSMIRRTRRQRRLAGSTIRRTIRWALLKTWNPTCPGETPSRCMVVMGCPRLVRPPLGLRRSKLSNTKNTDKRWAENKGEREKIEVCILVFVIVCCCSIGHHPSCIYGAAGLPVQERGLDSRPKP